MSERKPIPAISYKKAQKIAQDPTIDFYDSFKKISMNAAQLIKTMLSAGKVLENTEYRKRLSNDEVFEAEVKAMISQGALQAKALGDINAEANGFNAERNNSDDRTIFYTEKGFQIQEITDTITGEMLPIYLELCNDFNEFVVAQGRPEEKLKEIKTEPEEK